VPVGDEERELTAANTNDSIDWFGEMVARHLAATGVEPPLLLVPVPTSSATLDSSSGPWTSLLAIAVASNGMGDADVVDALRWKRRVEPPSLRTATAAELYENLAVTRRLDPDVPVVLVDYLFSAPATLQACAGRLSERGMRVELAVCAGRIAAGAAHDAFTVVTGALPEFEPGH
jgi:predicted amidophosphoribosyltransferase